MTAFTLAELSSKPARSRDKTFCCDFCEQPFVPIHGRGRYCYREECIAQRERLRNIRWHERRHAKRK